MNEKYFKQIGINGSLMNKYIFWEKYMDENIVFNLKNSQIHTKKHCSRVLFYAIAIGSLCSLDNSDIDSLAVAAIFHDSRRLNDDLDTGHGKRAALYYKNYCIKNELDFNDMTFSAIYYHDLHDNFSIKELNKKKDNKDSYVKLYKIFKDADALDRFRFGEFGLNISYLRFTESLELINIAKLMNGIAN